MVAVHLHDPKAFSRAHPPHETAPGGGVARVTFVLLWCALPIFDRITPSR